MSLYNDDCLAIMETFDKESIDFVFCDLPYGGGHTSCSWDIEIDLERFWKLINKITKKEAPIIFTCSTKFGNKLINSNPKNFRYDLVWVKSAPCGHLNSKRIPMRLHEMIYVFYRKLPKIYGENIRLYHKHKFLKEREIPFKNEEYQNRIIKPRNTIKSEETYGKDYLKKKENFRAYNPKLGAKGEESTLYEPPLPNSILQIRSQKGKHATQKPTELIKWLLKYYTKEGDIVLDPTMGSGTTGVACKEMKRDFIGIEKDNEIFKIAQSRINFN